MSAIDPKRSFASVRCGADRWPNTAARGDLIEGTHRYCGGNLNSRSIAWKRGSLRSGSRSLLTLRSSKAGSRRRIAASSQPSTRADFAAEMGHFDAAIAAVRRAVVLDPLARRSHSV